MTTRSHTSSPALPAESAAALQRLLDTELSLPSRLGYVALLLVALTMTGVITALWTTEPVLPLRAQVGFGLMVAIGVSWIIFAVWALTHRRILFARHQIVAGRMAVTFTTVFLLGTLGRGLQHRAAGSVQGHRGRHPVSSAWPWSCWCAPSARSRTSSAVATPWPASSDGAHDEAAEAVDGRSPRCFRRR